MALDAEARALFARKGLESGVRDPQAGEANGVKVRRVLQLTADLGGRPLGELRVLDLACGDGVYAIEAGLAGAEVVAIDARDERMREGAAVAARHGLARVRFELGDVRRVGLATHGRFDVAYVLGILYHLEAEDALALLERVRAMARVAIIDTWVAPRAGAEITWRGRAYGGERVREHGDDDPPQARRARLLRSIDNTFAFRFTRDALVRALGDVGFSAVLEAHAPLEPLKPGDRVTLAALAGERVAVATYPWVNGESEESIAARVAARLDHA